MLMLSVPTTVDARLKLAETLNHSGSLEFMTVYSKVEDQDQVISNIGTTRNYLSTYLWQPWIATLTGNLDLSAALRDSEIESTTTTDINGEVHLNVFPQSHFPFHAFVKKRNSLIEGDLTNQDLSMTSFGADQRYSHGPFTANASYQHSIDSSANPFLPANTFDSDTTKDQVQLQLSTSFDEHTLNITSKNDFISRTVPDSTETQFLQLLQHAYRPNDINLTVNNLVTYNDRSFELANGSDSDYSLLQVNSNAFWRPESEKDILVTGTALLQGSADPEVDQYGVFNSLAFSGQASYQWNPYLSLRGQASVFNSSDSAQTVQRAGIQYSPAEKPLFGIRHTYTVSVDAGNRTGGVEGTVQEGIVNAGHILSYGLPYAGGFINLSATQQAISVIDTDGTFDRTLTHSFNGSWNKATNAATTFINLTLNDTRLFSETDNQFDVQLANFQLTRTQRVGRNASFNGNVTFQISQQNFDNQVNAIDDLNFSSSVFLSYNHQNFLDVQRLMLRSEIRYMSNSFFMLLNSDGFNDEPRNNTYWENELLYSIGLLSFRLIGNLGESNGKLNNFVLFQIRRDYGR